MMSTTIMCLDAKLFSVLLLVFVIFVMAQLIGKRVQVLLLNNKKTKSAKLIYAKHGMNHGKWDFKMNKCVYIYILTYVHKI